jgi:uncharacterized protein (TIGR00297 family)
MKLFAFPSIEEWELFLTIFGAIIAFLAIVEFLRYLLHGSQEITRKTVHILIGVLIFFAPQLFHSGIPPLTFAVSFTAITFVTVKLGLLKSIHDTTRVSYGTVFYPVSLLLLIILFWDSAPHILSISILVMALGDAAAGIVGENISSPHEYRLTSDKKSIEGSSTMFAVTFFTILFSLRYFNLEIASTIAQQSIIALAAAIVATSWEALSSKGFDNFSVPISSAFILHYFLTPQSHYSQEQFLIGLGLALGIALISYYFKFLTVSGSVATFLLASTIYGIGGWTWTVPILTFFIASSLLSKFGRSRKKNYDQVFEKNDKRDEGQVAANGGMAGIIILLWYLFPEHTELYFIYLASLAAVTSDTWGTEVGTLWKGKPRSIITFKSVEAGTSGAVSIMGFVGGLFGAGLVVLSGYFMNQNIFSLKLILVIIVSGTVGSIVDSIFGATVQSQYLDASTGKMTEKTIVNGNKTSLVRGFSWLDNDVVNWACAVSGAFAFVLLM